jgi:hypothetical protein
MREQEVRELYDAYMQVHQPQEEVVQLDENIQDAAKGALEAGAKFMKTNPVGKAIGSVLSPVGSGRKTPTKESGGYRKEEVDLFDIILEYLVAEGYADTNEAALAIMVNMSEDWKESIVEEVLDEDANYDRNRKRAAQRAAARNAARDAGKTGAVPGVGYVTPRRESETYRDSAGVERHKSGAKNA